MENKKLQGSDGFYVFFHRQNRMEKTFSIGMSLMCERFFFPFHCYWRLQLPITCGSIRFFLRWMQWKYKKCNRFLRKTIFFKEKSRSTIWGYFRFYHSDESQMKIFCLIRPESIFITNVLWVYFDLKTENDFIGKISNWFWIHFKIKRTYETIISSKENAPFLFNQTIFSSRALTY